MNARMQAALLPGGRLHLHDGPIDLVIGADGAPETLRRAFAAATARFSTLLDELCGELALLRSPMAPDAPSPRGAVARRMDAAVRPLSDARFITRMAAVAGAGADEILAAMVSAAPLSRAYVNNGGDIAIHLAEGAAFGVGMANLPSPEAARSRSVGSRGALRIACADPVRGLATSGFGGRSFSLGIAEAVTVLASDAASADAAATLVANAVDLPRHPAISRAPARDLDPQSDLGPCLVTRAVGPLSAPEIAAALDAGVAEARRLIAQGAIVAASLTLRGETRVV